MLFRCEEVHGKLELASNKGAISLYSNEVLPRVDALLLGILERVAEPDLMYGILHSHVAVSHLRLLEHECNWSAALTGYDLQLQVGSS